MNIGQTNKVEERVFGDNLYVGCDSFTVLGINPTKEELAKIFNTNPERLKEQTYIQDNVKTMNSKGEESQGKELTIKVYIKSVSNAGKSPMINSISFKIKEGVFIGSKTGKHQVIDKYGQTAWVTEDEFKNKAIPVYENGSKSNISKDYRHTYYGEAEFINFVKAWLGIENPIIKDDYDNNEKKYKIIKWKEGEDLEACKVNIPIEEWKQLFNGNFKSIKELVDGREQFKFKAFAGISNGEKGSFQTISKNVLRNDASSFALNKVKKELMQDTYTQFYYEYEIEENGEKKKVREIPNFLKNVKIDIKPTDENQIDEVNDTDTSIKSDDLPF